MHPFSIPQFVGYAAFVLGVSAFLQRNDRRLKLLIAGESFVYTLHFVLLGNLPASASAFVSGTRAALSLKTRSLWIAAALVLVNLAVGAVFAKSPSGWLPVIASCIATVAMFAMEGIPLRVVLLTSTLLWLANNILSRSIGGTMLETVIAIVNFTTIVRMIRASMGTRGSSPLTNEAGD